MSRHETIRTGALIVCLALVGACLTAAPARGAEPEAEARGLLQAVEQALAGLEEIDTLAAEIDGAVRKLIAGGLDPDSEPVRVLIESRDAAAAPDPEALALVRSLAEWMGTDPDPARAAEILRQAATRLDDLVEKLESQKAGIAEYDRALSALADSGADHGASVGVLAQKRKEHVERYRALAGSLPGAGPAPDRTDEERPSPAPQAAESMDAVQRIRQAQRHYEDGDILFERGELRGAILQYDRSIQAFPGYAPAFFARGLAHAQLGDFRTAINDFKAAVGLAPDEMPEAFFNLGVAYFALRDYDAAIESFNSAIRVAPGFAEAYNGHGAVYASMGEFEEAVADFTQALSLRPDLAEAYYNRALAHKNLDDRRAAREDLRAYLEFDDINYRAEARQLLNSL